MRVLIIKMDCCQTAITQVFIDGRDLVVEQTSTFLALLGYTKIKNPDGYVAKIKTELKEKFPSYKKCKLLLIIPPDFCEERFLKDPDILKLAKAEGSSPKNFVSTEVGLGRMRLVSEQESYELDPLIISFCNQGLIPDWVVSPLYAAWQTTRLLLPQREDMLIIHPTFQSMSYTLIREGIPMTTKFGEASTASLINKLGMQGIDEIKALQMMLVFGVEPMELSDTTNYEYLEYRVELDPGKVDPDRGPRPDKRLKKGQKKKPEKKKETKPSKKKKPDLADFSLEDLSMTDMQFTTFTSAVSAFAEELKTEITLFLEDIHPGVKNFMVSSDTVTDLNMRIHDCAAIAEYILTVPSGMILRGYDGDIHNQTEEDLKTAQLLSIGAATAIFREADVGVKKRAR